jgi:hypothetical protein
MSIKGSDVNWLCDKFNIPALLVTGSVGSIEGVSDQRILRKSPDKEYFGKISLWAQQQLA